MKFWIGITAAAYLWIGGTSHAAGAPAAAKPNFLFVYTDDQRWDAMGFFQKLQGEKARFPWLKTPNMDRLVAEGTYFYERPYRVPTLVAVRTEDAKLSTYPGHADWMELFQLSKDPYEIHNLAQEAAAKSLRDRLESELTRQREATGYCVPPTAQKDTYMESEGKVGRKGK